MCLTVFIINKEEGRIKSRRKANKPEGTFHMLHCIEESNGGVWFLNKLKIKTIKLRSISLRTQMRSNQRCILCWHFSLQGVDLKTTWELWFQSSIVSSCLQPCAENGRGGHVLVLDIKFIRLAAREGWGRDICNQTRTSPIWWRRKRGV